MSVHQLSKKLRPSNKMPDSFVKSDIINGNALCIDVSVVLYKGLGTDEGAE